MIPIRTRRPTLRLQSSSARTRPSMQRRFGRPLNSLGLTISRRTRKSRQRRRQQLHNNTWSIFSTCRNVSCFSSFMYRIYERGESIVSCIRMFLESFFCGPKITIPPPTPSDGDSLSDKDHYSNPLDPPGLPKPRLARHHPYPLQSFMVQRPDTEEKALVKICTIKDLEVFHQLKLKHVPHRETTCNCFLSRLNPLPSWPVKEMELHYSAYKVLSSAKRILTIEFLRSLRADDLLDLTRTVLISQPDPISKIVEASKLKGQFPDPAESLRFVELCIEFYIMFELFSHF